MKKHIIAVCSIALLLALVAALAPVQVSITSEGMLSVETSVALAVQTDGDYPVTEQRYSPGESLVFHSGFETGDFGEWDSVNGSPTAQDTIKHTGSYAMRCNTPSTSAYAEKEFGDITFLSGSFYLYIASSLEDKVEILRVVLVTGSSYKVEYLQLDENNKLTVHNTLGSTALNNEQWHRISFVADFTDETNWIWDVWIDGNIEHSNVSDTPASYVTPCSVAVGLWGSETGDIYIDDVVIDGATDADIGDIRVLAALPNGEGTDQNTGTGEDWQDLSGNPATYDHVDNIPIAQTADYDWAEADGVMMRYTVGLQSLTDLGISGATIEAVNFIWYYKTGGGGGTDEYYKIIYDQGQRTEVSIDDPTDPTVLQSYEADCPSDSDAWTEAVFDACEMGMSTDDTNKDLWFYSGVAMVAYIPASGCTEDITNSPSSWSVNGGTPVATSSNYSTGLTHFTVTNNSGGAVDISISGTDMTGGNTWTLSDTATPSSMVYGLKAGLDGGDYTIIVKKNTPYNNLVAGLADSGTQDWGLKIYTPTEYTDGVTKSGTVTLTATCS